LQQKCCLLTLGLRELCWGNFKAIQLFWNIARRIIEDKRNNEEHNTPNHVVGWWRTGQIKGPNWGEIVGKEMNSSSSSRPIVCWVFFVPHDYPLI